MFNKNCEKCFMKLSKYKVSGKIVLNIQIKLNSAS